MQMMVTTNGGLRFPEVLVHWCAACDQAVEVELLGTRGECRCDAHLEADVADVGRVPCARQLVTVVFESCADCGVVRDVLLNH